ncbi:peptidase M14 [Galbibacter sp. BG1]|uniref:M14 family metallopeptidase n=1 Tax=Galbibacter sp. BG1 TaxID=1170699 RepID=UPI0015BB1A5F|nr:M14 metallopeptidase family protein [Galbibacter sp. BG1]QLE02561.1 peptidase M14 [Galbibacter sp. BG1]
MDLKEDFQYSYSSYKETQLEGRYITLDVIEPLLQDLKNDFNVDVIGHSVLGKAIHKISIGNGPKKILMWSQMHGNESTTTKAVFDLLNFIKQNKSFGDFVKEHFTLSIIPMLNPDGATAYTRVNKNEVDLNRDAQNLSQPESRVLNKEFKQFQPDFCFNLHDQRTIFSAGKHKKPATVSFLTPAEDKERKVTANRKKSMEVIVKLNEMLQTFIPNQVGRYDDGFNLNCVGDTFQSAGVPTLLFESGHFPNDYKREETRRLIAFSLVEALVFIGNTEITGDKYETYFKIPENEKLYYDIILRKFPFKNKDKVDTKDVAVFYKETLINGKVEFKPTVEHVEAHLHYFGHKELDMSVIDVDSVEIHDLNTAYLTELLKKI